MKTIPSGILFDLDGVFYTGGRAIPGGKETLAKLDAADIPYRFITNTTTKPASAIVKKLTELDITVNKEHILSAPVAAAHYLAKKGNPRCCFVLHPPVFEDFAGIPHDEDSPEYVVIGDIGKAWDYTLLNSLFGFLIKGAKLIALHKGRYWKTEKGLKMDIGAFVAGLEYASGKDATIIGKPSQTFFDTALENLGLPAHKVAVVGDDIDSDIGGAQSVDMQGILVRTGKFREDYTENNPVDPEAIIDSVADLPGLLGL